MTLFPRLSDPILSFAWLFAFTFSGTGAFGQPAQATPAVAAGSACEHVAQLALPNAKITRAELIAPGAFAGPRAAFTGLDLSSFYKTLPAFCRISAQATPTADSDIKIEVWLPVSGWNGRLHGIGNGGFAGLIDYFQLGAAVSQGFAATATDAGHTGTPIDAAWALGQPEKVIDFGHRGVHEMTRVAKAVVHSYYGTAVQHSYFAGCSDGGREALMEAQRYPDDYDGILAGAPANNWTPLLSTAVFDTQALTLDPASFIPPEKIPAISAAVIAACDQLDGVRDGILNDPRQCHFDPASMVCKNGEESDRCLTNPQAVALKQIYDGPHDAHGNALFPGYEPGAEDGPGGWAVWITGPAPRKSLTAFFGLGYFSNMVYEKSDWDYKTFTFEKGLKDAEEKTARALNATDPDLRAFQARGGKLILYHGWDDPAIPAGSTIHYYESLLAKMGLKTAEGFVRLYMLPGMQHCAGGPGPDSFGQPGEPGGPGPGAQSALEQWVEKGTPPSAMTAVKYGPNDPQHAIKMARPLCAYPQAAEYRGTGDTNQAENFVCRNQKP
jgi:hypothetical protein